MIQLNWYKIFGVQIPDGSTVLPTDDIQIWLHCANIWDKSYTTLAEVLADTTTLSALISSNNAVDYLVRSTTWAGVQVPVMTSDNTPSGECFGSSYYNDSRYRYYRSFDGTISSTEGWNSSENSQTEYIGYDFTRDVVVTKVELACRNSSYPQRNVTLRGSHDKVTWDDISVLSSNITDTNTHTYTVSNSTAYRYYSIQSTAGNGNVVTFSYIQFYTDSLCDNSTAMTYIGLNNYCANKLLADATWRTAICNSTYFESVLNVKIPVMTSNTTPAGYTASASSYDGPYEPYKAFNDDVNFGTIWRSASGEPQWVQCEFSAPKKVCKIRFGNSGGTGGNYIKGFKVYGVNNSTPTEIYSDTCVNHNGTYIEYFVIPNATNYDGYRFEVTSSYVTVSHKVSISALQFYGREDV